MRHLREFEEFDASEFEGYFDDVATMGFDHPLGTISFDLKFDKKIKYGSRYAGGSIKLSKPVSVSAGALGLSEEELGFKMISIKKVGYDFIGGITPNFESYSAVKESLSKLEGVLNEWKFKPKGRGTDSWKDESKMNSYLSESMGLIQNVIRSGYTLPKSKIVPVIIEADLLKSKSPGGPLVSQPADDHFRLIRQMESRGANIESFLELVLKKIEPSDKTEEKAFFVAKSGMESGAILMEEKEIAKLKLPLTGPWNIDFDWLRKKEAGRI